MSVKLFGGYQADCGNSSKGANLNLSAGIMLGAGVFVWIHWKNYFMRGEQACVSKTFFCLPR
ncbi:hypothetical protein [Candidatus Spongiihabitans sp.]|uniref:hypothetical protein n=1 Tax=Candidatus Spongiihabitans sp. TaxID=3101308 RepID=UPI003C6EA50A